MTMAAVITLRGIARRFAVGGETVHALTGIDLDLAKGEMVALTGPSGSGKSTLMNVIGCLDRPDAGTYHLAGEDVAALAGDRLAELRNRHIGFVFQNFHLMPRLDAVENVALPLRYAGATDILYRAEAALARVGLADRRHHRPNQLSGGQRQRVAIARALVTDPALILADEPTGNLDRRIGDEVLALFAALHAEGRTIVIVTHDAALAARCPRQVRLVDGRIIHDSAVKLPQRPTCDAG